jgi:hypothetical protein
MVNFHFTSLGEDALFCVKALYLRGSNENQNVIDILVPCNMTLVTFQIYIILFQYNGAFQDHDQAGIIITELFSYLWLSHW